MRTNCERAARAFEAVRAYAGDENPLDEGMVPDLITDLLHLWLRDNGPDALLTMTRTAVWNFLDEQGEDRYKTAIDFPVPAEWSDEEPEEVEGKDRL